MAGGHSAQEMNEVDHGRVDGTARRGPQLEAGGGPSVWRSVEGLGGALNERRKHERMGKVACGI